MILRGDRRDRRLNGKGFISEFGGNGKGFISEFGGIVKPSACARMVN